MNLVDKFLLVLMVIILPIGLIVGYYFRSSEPKNDDLEMVVDTAKLAELVEEVNTRKAQENQPKDPEFFLGEIEYASESGELSLAGAAPDKKKAVIVSVTIFSKENQISDEEGKERKVKGNKVETWSVLPQEDGRFDFYYEVSEQNQEDVIEIRFEQDKQVKTLRYDLLKNIQVL